MSQSVDNPTHKPQKKSSFSHDFLASVVVFLVALPLCLGISIAAGYPPAAGLISGIIGGIIVGYFAGCPLQVSGPAAGLITLVWEAVNQFGIETVGLMVLMAGLFQIAAGFMGWGLWFRAVSPAVIQGMLAGIGVLIFSSQFHVMMDVKPESGGLENLLTIPESIIKGIFPVDGSVHHIAAVVGLITILTIVIWNIVPRLKIMSFLPAKLKVIPAPLVAVVFATLVASVMQLPINYVEVPGNIFASLQFLNLDLLEKITDMQVVINAFAIAFVASAETLLTATAVDRMSGKTRTNYNKEIIAQGIGNSLAGILGVLPITGVIVRSSANVQAGGETRHSTMLHGLWILLFVLLIPFVLELIPVASLAAILVYTGYKLVNIKAAKNLASYGKSEVFIYCATVIGIVVTNLLEGVLIGIGLALLKQFYLHSHLHIHKTEFTEENQIHISFTGSASFITLPKLASSLESLPAGYEVFVHIENLAFIDHACIEFLQSWEKQYTQQEGSVTLEWEGMMNRFSTLTSPAGKNNSVSHSVSPSNRP